MLSPSASVSTLVSSKKIIVDQIMLELHGVDFNNIKALFLAADDARMRVFHKERNHWGCEGYRCLEYAFVSEEFLREANAHALSVGEREQGGAGQAMGGELWSTPSEL